MAHSHHHQQGVAREHLHFPQMMPDDLFTAGFGGLSGGPGLDVYAGVHSHQASATAPGLQWRGLHHHHHPASHSSIDPLALAGSGSAALLSHLSMQQQHHGGSGHLMTEALALQLGGSLHASGSLGALAGIAHPGDDGQRRGSEGGTAATSSGNDPPESPARPKLPRPDMNEPCPRCNSSQTKFCYYNNYNLKQPRYYCKSCQRYWTAGGTLRNIAPGSGRRKTKTGGKDCDKAVLLELAREQGPGSGSAADAAADAAATSVALVGTTPLSVYGPASPLRSAASAQDDRPAGRDSSSGAEGLAAAYGGGAAQQQQLLGHLPVLSGVKLHHPPDHQQQQWGSAAAGDPDAQPQLRALPSQGQHHHKHHHHAAQGQGQGGLQYTERDVLRLFTQGSRFESSSSLPLPMHQHHQQHHHHGGGGVQQSSASLPAMLRPSSRAVGGGGFPVEVGVSSLSAGALDDACSDDLRASPQLRHIKVKVDHQMTGSLGFHRAGHGCVSPGHGPGPDSGMMDDGRGSPRLDPHDHHHHGKPRPYQHHSHQQQQHYHHHHSQPYQHQQTGSQLQRHSGGGGSGTWQAAGQHEGHDAHGASILDLSNSLLQGVGPGPDWLGLGVSAGKGLGSGANAAAAQMLQVQAAGWDNSAGGVGGGGAPGPYWAATSLWPYSAAPSRGRDVNLAKAQAQSEQDILMASYNPYAAMAAAGYSSGGPQLR